MYISKWIKTLVLVAILAVQTPLYAWQGDIDLQRLDRDLRISQEILKNIFSELVVRDFYDENNIKGSYLEGYGVIFLVPLSTHSVSGERADRAEAVIDNLQNDLYDFFSSYADVIGQIRPNDKISIIATPSTSRPTTLYYLSDQQVVFSSGSRESFRISPYTMTVKKSDIGRYRSGQINDSQFRNLVEYVEVGKDDSYLPQTLLKDIKIMRGIFEMSLNDHFSNGISSSAFQGTYIRNYGILFTINGGSRVSVPVPLAVQPTPVQNKDIDFIFDVSKDLTIDTDLVVQNVGLVELQRALIQEDARLNLRDFGSYGFQGSNEKLLNTIVESMTDVLANYGRTLRGLNQNDKISILYSSNGERMRKVGNKNLMLTVNFNDILAYARGSMDFEKFKERVTAKTF